MKMLLSYTKMKITLEEEQKVIRKYPEILKQVIDSMEIWEEDRYDRLKKLYDEYEEIPEND